MNIVREITYLQYAKPLSQTIIKLLVVDMVWVTSDTILLSKLIRESQIQFVQSLPNLRQIIYFVVILILLFYCTPTCLLVVLFIYLPDSYSSFLFEQW